MFAVHKHKANERTQRSKQENKIKYIPKKFLILINKIKKNFRKKLGTSVGDHERIIFSYQLYKYKILIKTVFGVELDSF
jgi:hypothetical protein